MLLIRFRGICVRSSSRRYRKITLPILRLRRSGASSPWRRPLTVRRTLATGDLDIVDYLKLVTVPYRSFILDWIENVHVNVHVLRPLVSHIDLYSTFFLVRLPQWRTYHETSLSPCRDASCLRHLPYQDYYSSAGHCKTATVPLRTSDRVLSCKRSFGHCLSTTQDGSNTICTLNAGTHWVYVMRPLRDYFAMNP